MLTQQFTIQNKYGLHARPAKLIVETASKFRSDIYLAKENDEMNAKSIMGILMLEAKQGSILELRIQGEDQDDALQALAKVFEEIANLEENL